MNKANGFTLVELLTTLALTAVVLAIAVPSFVNTVQNNRITSQANEFIAALNLARIEAIRRGAPISVCASTDQATCSGANNWATGWIVFEDNNTAGNPAIAELIRVWDALPGGPTFTENGGADFVRYQPNGTMGVAQAFTHTIPDCSGNQLRAINITPAGRVSVQRNLCP